MSRPPFPLTLDELFSTFAEKGILQHLSISKTGESGWQASYKRPGTNAYAVHIHDDLSEAVRGALHPGWGKSWSEVLGPDYDHIILPWESSLAASKADEDDDEEDIL